MDNIIKAWIGSDNISKYNEESGCIDVFTPHALIQIAGFVKYKMKDDIIMYRGQTSDYGVLKPSLYRGKEGGRISDRSAKRKTDYLNLIIGELAKQYAFFSSVDKYYYESILQHYGFKTHYIDFVDNTWVALIFSSLAWRCNGYNRFDELMYFDDKGYGDICIVCWENNQHK